MLVALTALLRANLGKVLLYGSIALLFAGYTAAVYMAGKNSVKIEAMENTIEKVEDTNEIRNSIKRMPDGVAAIELLKNWSR